jgi:succinate dehydrogenase/fumarate reductase cytochrome b subunit
MFRFLFGILILAVDIWAILNVVQSRASTTEKVLWAVGIVVFPLLGFIAWLLFGPRAATT